MTHNGPVAFVFVTGSDDKAREAREILGFPVERVALDLREIQAASPAEVAHEKAREAFRRLARPCVVEDSGLELAAWGGFPGPFVKWLEKQAGLPALCRALDGFEDRGAEAVCALAYASHGREFVAVGRTAGSIAKEPRGSGGFGWDAIFIPGGETRTFAEMAAEEKNRVSHRRKAWDEFRRRMG